MAEAAKPPEPGIYHKVDFDEYLTWPCVNNSSLSYAQRSMAHYRYAPPITTTDAMRFGSLVHTGKLEPAAIGARYAVQPDFANDIRKPDGSQYSNVRATKAYKEAVASWRETIGDREICTSEEMEVMLGMVQALVMHERARNWLCGDGDAEVSVVWDDPESGVRCKARVDKWAPGVLVDLKTTRDASDFERAVAKYSYHRQAAFYCDGIEAATGEMCRFGIVAVEKEIPFGVRAAVVSEAAMDVGRREYKSLLQQLSVARKTNVWPSYDDPAEWSLPGWYMATQVEEELGITINGEVVL